MRVLAQKAMGSYLRSVALMPDKEVHDVQSIDREALAFSFGLPQVRAGAWRGVERSARHPVRTVVRLDRQRANIHVITILNGDVFFGV